MMKIRQLFLISLVLSAPTFAAAEESKYLNAAKTVVGSVGAETMLQSASLSFKYALLDTIPDLILTGPDGQGLQYGKYPRFGDVNGDGYEDFLVAGACRFDNERGRLYLYYGGRKMRDIPDMILTGDQAGDWFGEDACLGDVNGDGYSDIITCACCYNNRQGRVYIFYGGSEMDDSPDVICDGEPEVGGAFGHSMTAGDLNKDGYDDVVVTASLFNNKTGRVYLFYGGDPMDTTPDLILDGERENDRFGRDNNNPKMIGDVNGDGYGDLLISTRTWNFWEGVSGQGRAYLYYGGPGTTMDSIPDKIFTGENPRDDFGVAGCLYDIDNDGFSDVIIGARYYNNIQGRVYLYWGGKDMDIVPDKVFDGEIGEKASFGCGLDAGHINDDDYGDIVVAAPYYDRKPWAGKAYLFYGGIKARMDTICDKTFTLPTDAKTGSQHVALGDINNDGCPEIAIAGYLYNNEQGRVWIYDNKPTGSADQSPISLQEAAATCEAEEVRVLLSKGADANAGEWGSFKTALHYAAERGHTKIVEMLLAKSANTKVMDALGATPLHYAGKKGHKAIVELLIKSGADVNAKDGQGKTALDYAKQFNKKEVADLLKKHGATEEPPQSTREKWQSMSSEEREKLKEQLRKRLENNKKQEPKE